MTGMMSVDAELSRSRGVASVAVDRHGFLS
jgi:hypothetical protein